MSNQVRYKCPFCEYITIQKQSLYNHMDKTHQEELKELPPAQVYFNYKNHKEFGLCIVCKKNHTEFNLKTEKYERICSNLKCKEDYRKMFVDRMKNKYGKETLLNDPEQQKKMLANRKISGTYTWSTNKKAKFTYTGSYEKEFLEFLDIFLNWNPEDLFFPSPIIFKYVYEGKKHFYMPDVYIPSLNLIIEIKSLENTHYRLRDIDIEKLKDITVEKSKYNYFKVTDKKYDAFFNYFIELTKKLSSSKSSTLA